MATKIQWTNETWNPVVGCSKISPGCKNCYAERMAKRLKGMAEAKLRDNPHVDDGTIKYLNVVDEHGWTGWPGIAGVDEWTQPLRWRKPRRVFVVSMGDLFHPRVPVWVIDRVFGIMALAKQHTFQVLTKRPNRMREYFEKLESRAFGTSAELEYENCTYPQSQIYNLWGTEVRKVWDGEILINRPWPLSNVWLGTSIEDQENSSRIADLVPCPAVVHFVSVEPMLSWVNLDLSGVNYGRDHDGWSEQLDWVICGGESGPGARPMDPYWAHDLLAQCRQAEIPFFFKQGSANNWPDYKTFESFPDGLQVREYPDTFGGNDE